MLARVTLISYLLTTARKWAWNVLMRSSLTNCFLSSSAGGSLIQSNKQFSLKFTSLRLKTTNFLSFSKQLKISLREQRASLIAGLGRLIYAYYLG